MTAVSIAQASGQLPKSELSHPVDGTAFRYDMTLRETIAVRRGKQLEGGTRFNESQNSRRSVMNTSRGRRLKRGGWDSRGTCVSKNHHNQELDADITYSFESAYCLYPESLKGYEVECLERYHGLGRSPELATFIGYCPPETYCVNDFELGIAESKDITCAPILDLEPEEPYSIALSPSRTRPSRVCTDTKEVPFKTQAEVKKESHSRGHGSQSSKRVRHYRIFEEAVNGQGKSVQVARLWIEDDSSRFQFPRAERSDANMTAFTITINQRNGDLKHKVRFCAELSEGAGPWTVVHYGSYEVFP